jgi:hypothetical protein
MHRKQVELVLYNYPGVFDYGIERMDSRFSSRYTVPPESAARLLASSRATMLIPGVPATGLPDAELVRSYLPRW